MTRAELGDILILTGKDKKGRQRIKQHGEKWVVVEIKDTVVFNPEPGPWLLVEPELGQRQAMRWINPQNDPHFKIEKPV